VIEWFAINLETGEVQNGRWLIDVAQPLDDMLPTDMHVTAIRHDRRTRGEQCVGTITVEINEQGKEFEVSTTTASVTLEHALLIELFHKVMGSKDRKRNAPLGSNLPMQDVSE
jgi:hypothetical protein